MKDKTIKIFGILFLLLIPFHELIETFISNVFVLTIFNKLDSNLSNDIVVLIFVIFLFFSFVSGIKRNVYISNNYTFILSGLTIVYIYYRYFGDTWTFIKFDTISKIAYSDLFLLFVVSEWIKKLNYQPKKSTIDTSKGFLFDNPLGQNDNDTLQREGYALSICEKIKNTENKESAFSIGLNGDWGVGKTSFFNLIKRNLSDSENIIFDFNPWLNNGSKSIINEFFKLLSIEVNKYNSNLSKKIELYGKLLLQFGDSNLNKVVKPLIYLNNLNNVAQTQYVEINSSISKLNKKLIIFIDDLDRLDNNEIIEVIRIIRNTANFANTIFIAAYDRNYLINALSKINSHNSEFFLEKIFQVEVHLPEYEIKTIKKRVFDLIENNLTAEDKKKLISLFFDKNYSFSLNFSHNYSENIIRTIRDATRLANSFNLSYSHLKGEVNIKDLYYLELLKLKYPGVYNVILQERDNFLTLDNENSSGFSYRSYSFYSLKKYKNRQSKESDSEQVFDYAIESYLTDNATTIGIHKKSIPSIIDILKFLFPEKNASYTAELEPLSMADPKCYDRYSYYRLLDENLSQVEFDEYLNKTPDELNIKMKDWVSNGLRREIADKFRRIKDFGSKEKFEKVILGIFNSARIPEQESIENDYSGYDYHDLRNKIDNSKGRLSDLLYDRNEKEYQAFIKSIFENAPSPYRFEISFIRSVLKTYDYAGFDLDKEYLDNLILSYFTNYLDSIDKIDITVFRLYHDCGLEEANEPFRKFIEEKDLDGFLYWMYYSEPFDREGFALVADNIVKIFGGFNEFEDFLNQFEEGDYEYLSEFKRFFEECKKVDFKVFVKFKFNHIPPRK